MGSVIRDPAAIAALCGHTPPRAGCHLCKLAGRKATAVTTSTATKKKPCGCGTCDDCPPPDQAAPTALRETPADPHFPRQNSAP